MPRGIYKRKKKVGRPKGKKNRPITSKDLKEIGEKPTQYDESFGKAGYKIGEILRIRLPDDYKVSEGPKLHIANEPPSYLSRLEAATVKYEQAINEAITALKGQ